MLLMSINWNSFTPIRIFSQGSPSCELHSCWPEVQLEQGCMAGQSSISTQMPSSAEKVNQKHLGLVWHNRRQVVELEAGSALMIMPKFLFRTRRWFVLLRKLFSPDDGAFTATLFTTGKR